MSKKRVLTEFRRKYLRFNVAEQRRNLKLRCIEYKGGKCVKCGYNKCPAALTFHHLDPLQKDFQISGSSRSFEKCKPELDKCELLCSNCHAETHHTETEIARNNKRQEIENETREIKDTINIKCSFCNKEIKVFGSRVKNKNYCSRDCKINHSRAIEWPDDNQFINLIKTHSVKEVSQILNKPFQSVYKHLNFLKQTFPGIIIGNEIDC